MFRELAAERRASRTSKAAVQTLDAAAEE
jgi:hypothetical protein